MKVTAKKEGYYGKTLRAVGSSFVLNDKKDFSESWMEKAGESKKPKEVSDEEQAEIEEEIEEQVAEQASKKKTSKKKKASEKAVI